MLRKDTTLKAEGSRISRLRKSGLRALVLLAAAGAVGFAAGGGRSAEGAPPKVGAGDLQAAVRKLGVAIRPEGRLELYQNRTTVWAAPAANLETIAAPSYGKGVDLGAAYLDLPGPVETKGGSRVKVAKGFYRVRAVADDVQRVGKTGGHVLLVNAQGRTVAELPADVDIFSLTLPPEAKTERTYLALKTDQSGTGVQAAYVILICWHCANGAVVCLRLNISLPF